MGCGDPFRGERTSDLAEAPPAGDFHPDALDDAFRKSDGTARRPSHERLYTLQPEEHVARKSADDLARARKDETTNSRTLRRSKARTGSSRSPGRKGAEKLERSEQATALAFAAARRVGNRQMPIRNSFAKAGDDDVDPPPLARMFRGGRGGTVRLKLYLTMLWIAGNAPHDVKFPARSWAELLDLPDPERKGDRRIRDGIDWLAAHEFIRVERQPGRPATLYLQREDGSGEPYTVLGATEKDKKTGKFPETDIYVSLPPTFWTSGWAAGLSGAGTAILLVMLVLTRAWQGEPFWISPGEARRKFHLSEDTWTKGVRELCDLGLLHVGRKPVSEEFGWRRVRNLYSLDLGPLQSRRPKSSE